MIKKISFVLALVTAGCVSRFKCGNPDGSLVIFDTQKSCKVRVRHVTVFEDLPVPKTFKGVSFVHYELDWRKPEFKPGELVLGHFVLKSKEVSP